MHPGEEISWILLASVSSLLGLDALARHGVPGRVRQLAGVRAVELGAGLAGAVLPAALHSLALADRVVVRARLDALAANEVAIGRAAVGAVAVSALADAVGDDDRRSVQRAYHLLAAEILEAIVGRRQRGRRRRGHATARRRVAGIHIQIGLSRSGRMPGSASEPCAN